MARNEDRQSAQQGFWRLNGWGAPILGMLAVLMLLAGISASQAEATDDVPGNEEEICATEDCDDDRGSRWGRQRHHRRWFGKRHHDPERAKEKMQFATGWMLRRLDVEDDVEDQIQARLATAFDDLYPLVEAHKGSHGRFTGSILGTEEVDREALEVQRVATLASIDQATQIVTDAIADVAELLTPEQRAKLAKRIDRHRH